MTAADYHAKLIANTEAWYADAIDFDAFRANQRLLWDSIQAAACQEEVLALHRKRNAA